MEKIPFLDRKSKPSISLNLNASGANQSAPPGNGILAVVVIAYYGFKKLLEKHK